MRILFGIALPILLFCTGCVFIITEQGIAFFPSHQISTGALSGGVPLVGESAVMSGFASIVWALFFHLGYYWEDKHSYSEETWSKLVMSLFGLGTFLVVWALISGIN